LQRDHDNTVFKEQKVEIIVVCDGMQSPANVGGLFRICEAFGVARIIFSETTIDFNSARLKRTARGTNDRVPYSLTEDILETLIEYTSLGFDIFGLEITSTSQPLASLEVSEQRKVVWVIGHESTGVSEKVLHSYKNHYHIDMFGSNSSINVIQALGIALFKVTNI